MDSEQRLRSALGEVIRGVSPGMSTGDRLCYACVDLLGVDDAALSMITDGRITGTFGSSGQASADLDGLQMLYGEGPCLEAVTSGGPVLTEDVTQESRWPMFRASLLDRGYSGVYAFPVRVSTSRVGALDLFRQKGGGLSTRDIGGALLAAELASLVALDAMAPALTPAGDEAADDAWTQLGMLSGVEVSQATGMVMGQLGVGPAEALVRLRAHAFAQGVSISAVAWDVVERRLLLEADGASA